LLSVLVYLLISIVILSAISITTIMIEEQKKQHQHQNFAYASAASSSSLISDFNFAAVGDWECTSHTIDTVNNILDKKPELVLGLGDFSYNPTADCWFKIVDPIDEIMKIAIGNHDEDSSAELNSLMSHFNLTKPYYSFDYQNVHFTIIYSSPGETSHQTIKAPLTEGSEQYEFIKNDLAKASTDPNIDWIVAVYHKFAYTSPSTLETVNEIRNILHPLFDRYGVDLVLEGHQHNYQRSYPMKYNKDNPDDPVIATDSNNRNTYTTSEGPIFVTVGTGGATLFNLTGKAPYIASQHVGYGILNVDVINNGKTLNVKFDEDVDGIVKDQFTITKSGDDDLPLPLPVDLSAQEEETDGLDEGDDGVGFDDALASEKSEEVDAAEDVGTLYDNNGREINDQSTITKSIFNTTIIDDDKNNPPQPDLSQNNQQQQPPPSTSPPSNELGPTIIDNTNGELKVESVFKGIDLPTTMAFLGPDDILVLEKDNGIVRRIVNGTLLPEPLLDVSVANKHERGMLGIAVAEKTNPIAPPYVFLYFTESAATKEEDGSDDCPSPNSCNPGNDPLGNRLYRYELINNKLVNPVLLLDLPATPGPIHNGGGITIGPDNNLYLAIGDVKFKADLQKKESSFDGRSGILRITLDGKAVEEEEGGGGGGNIIGDNDGSSSSSSSNNNNEDIINKYYAYGIRNSFGLDFDPVTGKLWDTENGPSFGDEINLIEPGFNSGWKDVQGIWKVNGGKEGDVELNPSDGLADFDGKGKYSAPEFIWENVVGPTAIKFLDSDKLGKQYQNDIFVGDFHNGNLYHFDLDQDRSGLVLDAPLNADDADNNIINNIAASTDDDKEEENKLLLSKALFGKGFGAITDIEVGPDGYLYVVSIGLGEILRIVPSTA
jgi:aldose sugar dehydrogenase